MCLLVITFPVVIENKDLQKPLQEYLLLFLLLLLLLVVVVVVIV